MPVLLRPKRREFEFPGIKVAARPATSSQRGSGPGPGTRDGRMSRAPAASDGRAANKWFGDGSRDPTVSTFLPRGGGTARRRRGKRGGKGGARLSVPCACAERRLASGSALRRISPHGPPAWVLATAESHRWHEGSSAARRPLKSSLGL